MKTTPSFRLLAASSLIVSALFAPRLLGTQGTPASTFEADRLVMIPHVISSAQALVPVDAQLFILNPIDRELPGGTAQLGFLRVSLEGVVVEERNLETTLTGDPRFRNLMAEVERLPRSVTELQRPNYIIDANAESYTGPDVTRVLSNIASDLQNLRGEWDAGRPEPFTAIDFRFELDQLFAPEELPGSTRDVLLELGWTSASGQSFTQSVTQTITRQAPRLSLPTSLSRDPFNLAASAPHEHAGDLHVHSCHGEAAGACAPSGNCGAETLQLSGSFTYAQLKSQYTALGVDWFTATDHSYCIDSSSEYNTVANECSALTDAGFIAIPDTELSSDESGAQTGSDLGNTLCLGGTEANHMGAHGISQWVHGGSQGFWGFCDGLFTDELESFGSNINKIRNDGGYPIVNHPAAGEFGWNSVASLQGIENNDAHGVEIWNGSSQIGQGEGVGAWVNWLEAGRILFAYSGSDTHDEAFAFGSNHVMLEAVEGFTPFNVQRAVREGRLYISNGHVLVHEAELGGDRIGMGSIQALAPAQQGQSVTVEAHYNFGTDFSTITLFSGANGVQESVLATSGPLTGQGVFSFAFTPAAGKTSWTRAYSESGSMTAYTNPIFYRPSNLSSTAYGGAAGGANIATLSSAASPSLGASVEVDINAMTGASAAILVMSATQDAAGTPFAGGTLLLGLPVFLQIPVTLDAAGDGDFNFRVPNIPSLVGGSLFWQALGLSAVVPGQIAFTNGLSMPIGGI